MFSSRKWINKLSNREYIRTFDREILDLKNINISLEKLLEKLQEKYPNNIEVITLKALVILLKNNREKAINECLKGY